MVHHAALPAPRPEAEFSPTTHEVSPAASPEAQAAVARMLALLQELHDEGMTDEEIAYLFDEDAPPPPPRAPR